MRVFIRIRIERIAKRAPGAGGQIALSREETAALFRGESEPTFDFSSNELSAQRRPFQDVQASEGMTDGIRRPKLITDWHAGNLVLRLPECDEIDHEQVSFGPFFEVQTGDFRGKHR